VRSCGFWQVVYWDQWAEIQSSRSWGSEDPQSSSKKLELQHFESDQYWSQIQVGERIRRAECHLHRDDDLGIQKWEYSKEWCTWWRVKDRKRSPGEHHRRMCTRKTDYCHIWHGSNEMTDMTWTSWGQRHGYRTRMRGGWSRCHGQYSVKSSREIEKAKTRHFLWSYCNKRIWMNECINEMIMDAQKRAVSVGSCLQRADRWGLSKLLEVRWSMRRNLMTRSIILYMIWPVVRELVFIQGGFLEQWRNDRFL